MSIKSEYEYNNDLAKFFLRDNSYGISSSSDFCISLESKADSDLEKKNIIFVHPFTGGSSKTLSCNDFIELCKELDKLNNCSFILHCDCKDYPKCIELEKKAEGLDIRTISPTKNLSTMFNNINQCDLFIAGSTGPLHVAAALNKKTVGFYPTKISSTLLRWDTINDEKNNNQTNLFEKADILLTVGKLAKNAQSNSNNFALSLHFNDNFSLLEKLNELLTDGDIVLIKGSRSMQLNQLINELKNVK